MAKKRKVRKAVSAVNSVIKEVALALLTTRSAGKPSLADLGVPVPTTSKRKRKATMAKKRKQSSRGRKQDRARVAGGQD